MTPLDFEKVGGGCDWTDNRSDDPPPGAPGKPWARHQQLGPWPSPQAASIAQTDGFATRPGRPEAAVIGAPMCRETRRGIYAAQTSGRDPYRDA